MCARKAFITRRSSMRFFATFVAVIFLVEAAPRHGLKAVPYSRVVASRPVGHGLQTVPYPNPGTWSEQARLGEARTEAAVVFLNRRIYVLGGMARGQDSHALNQEYDPASDRWRERAPMPHALSHPGAGAMNGRIYVVGGFLRNVHLDAQDFVFEYAPASD